MDCFVIYSVCYSLIFRDGCQFWKALGHLSLLYFFYFLYFTWCILIFWYCKAVLNVIFSLLLFLSFLSFFSLWNFYWSFFFFFFLFIFLTLHWFFWAMLSLPISPLKSFIISITIWFLALPFKKLFHVWAWLYYSFIAFYLSLYITHPSCMLSSLSIEAFNLLIIVILNCLSHNLSIYFIFEYASYTCFGSSDLFFCLLACF